MNDDSLSDTQQPLPPSEFDPRAAVRRRFDDSLSDAAIMTVGKVRDRVAGLMLDIEALKLVDGDSLYLQVAGLHVRKVLSNVEDHSRVAAAADAALKAEIEHLC